MRRLLTTLLAALALAFGALVAPPVSADVTVIGDDKTDAFVGSGSLLLPSSMFANGRTEAADCPGCSWRAVVQCEMTTAGSCRGPARLCGPDATWLRIYMTRPTGEEVDLGQVGDVVEVNPQFVSDLLDDGRIPVVSTVASDRSGVPHNVNADTAAAALAVALDAQKLVVLTDVEGLYADWPVSTEVVRRITPSELSDLLPSLDAGMLPKMEACLRAVSAGVPRAHVIDGRVAHSLLVEVFTDEGVGTMVTTEVGTP